MSDVFTPKVAIIYDTSFLMGDSEPILAPSMVANGIFYWLVDNEATKVFFQIARKNPHYQPLSPNGKYRYCKMLDANLIRLSQREIGNKDDYVLSEICDDNWAIKYDLDSIVPVEVKMELKNHFADENKSPKARLARKRIAFIAEKGKLIEPVLEKITTPIVSEDCIGPDSLTDRLIIGYGIDLLKSKKYLSVFVASEDGGIMLDMNRRKMDNFLCIYTKFGASNDFASEIRYYVTPKFEKMDVKALHHYEISQVFIPKKAKRRNG